ncbi:hypothetical protein ACYSUW_13420 [Pseudomonas frederiksbergensis]
MSQPILFPYHPIMGNRLIATLDFVLGTVPRDIHKEDGQIVLGEASETEMNWNAAEEQSMHGVRFLVTEDGHECLEHEALWREEDVDHIVIDAPGTAATAHTANTLRDQLAELGSAAREVVLNAEAGQKNGNALAQLKHLLESLGLMEPVDEE